MKYIINIVDIHDIKYINYTKYMNDFVYIAYVNDKSS